MPAAPWVSMRWIGRRYLRHFLIVGAVAVVALIGALFGPPPRPIAGRAEVTDGDTLRIAGTRIRILGIDAPELAQTCTDASGKDWPCGAEAKAFVVGLVARQDLSCSLRGTDVYGRSLGTCMVGGQDLGQAVMVAGWAVSDGGYVAEEAGARAAGRGIWSGSFIAPAEWRRSHGEGGNGFDWLSHLWR